MSSTTLPVCPKTGSTSPSLTVHLCLHTALLREIGNAPTGTVPQTVLFPDLFVKPLGAHSRFPGHALTPTGVMAIRCKQFHLPDL